MTLKAITSSIRSRITYLTEKINLNTSKQPYNILKFHLRPGASMLKYFNGHAKNAHTILILKVERKNLSK